MMLQQKQQRFVKGVVVAVIAVMMIAMAATPARGQEEEEAAATTTLPDQLIAPEFVVEVSDVTLSDTETGFGDIATIHNGKFFDVQASLTWAEAAFVPNSTNTLLWEMLVDGVVAGQGSVDLLESRALPDSLAAGNATVYNSGRHTIAVKIFLDGESNSNEDSREYESFNGGASFVPLIMVLLFAMTTHNVELSLGCGIFTGACLVTGTITDGFKTTLDTYILNALANEDHSYVILFTLFLSGMVGQLQKSGGLDGITEALKGFVTSPRSAQICTFFAGLMIFFDDYANTLVAGMSMRPLSDASFISREKLAFIVDATAAPVASIVPISSWVGFEVSLIQAELDKILENDPDPRISTTGFGVFLETIQYRYYCIFMLFLMPLLILTGRDMGTMLLAERRVRVPRRTDGGDGKEAKKVAMVDPNAPQEDTPCRWWNMVVPILFLVAYIFAFLVISGDDGSGTQTFMEKIENSHSYKALLWGTMAAALTAFAFYIFQDKKDGRIIWFNLKGRHHQLIRFLKSYKWIRSRFFKNSDDADETNEEPNEDDEKHAERLLTWPVAMDAFLVGMERIFPALVVLTLAWAMGAVVVACGLDRYFGDLIVNGNLDAGWMPTISFLVSMFVAFATGTSWGTMTIMFPLMLVPSYVASDGDPVIFYGTTAGILAGAVAGDHASPISDTTVLSALATECQLLAHVRTQAPYVLIVVIWSVLVGTIPTGLGTLGSGVCIFLGFIFMVFHTVFTSASVMNKTGRFDIFTEIYARLSKDEEIKQLRIETATAYEEEGLDAHEGLWRSWFPFLKGAGTPGTAADGKKGGDGPPEAPVDETAHMDVSNSNHNQDDFTSGHHVADEVSADIPAEIPEEEEVSELFT